MSFWDQFVRQHLVAAHRGNRSVRAENTLSAFEESIGRCDFVELDVGFSRDGVPIVIHDDTLVRTSDAVDIKGFTPPYAVIDYSYAELQKLDFSSWFLKSDPFGTLLHNDTLYTKVQKLPPQRISTLYEVLVFLKGKGLSVNVEIKDMKDTPFDALAVKKTLEVIGIAEMKKRVLVSSFNHGYIKEVQGVSSDIDVAVLQEKSHPDNLLAYLADMGVTCYHCDRQIVTPEIVMLLTNAGITVNVYTVNDPQEKKKLFSWGVRTIFTDFL